MAYAIVIWKNVMDKVDREIVTLLEADARQSFAELGQKIGLSKTPSWQRVRELERTGVIRGYRAEIDPSQLGLHVHAFVHVTINSTKHAEFESAASHHPAILQCFTTAGQADYLMHVLVAGISELDQLLRMEISRMPGVQRLETTVCMKTIKHRAPIMGCLR
jgi:Lrp/AsnC family transcriptional regulator, leucine-responsive regulatory protein